MHHVPHRGTIAGRRRPPGGTTRSVDKGSIDRFDNDRFAGISAALSQLRQDGIGGRARDVELDRVFSLDAWPGGCRRPDRGTGQHY